MLLAEAGRNTTVVGAQIESQDGAGARLAGSGQESLDRKKQEGLV